MMNEAIAIKAAVWGATKFMLPVAGAAVPWFMLADGYIDQHTAVPLSIVGSAIGLAVYLTNRFTKLEEKVESLAKNLADRPCQISHCPQANDK